jgi:Mrp family chromosome partitioning ATPase/capsular polysaccharide biosynthesis protein
VERFSRQEVTSLGTYISILRRRGWIVVLCGLVAAAVAYELSNRQPAQYSSSSAVYINQQDIASALTGISTNDYSSAALAVDTQASLAAVPAVASRALRVARLTDRTPAGLLNQVSIAPDESTNILTFTVVDHSPVTSALLATSYARAFAAYSNELSSKPIVKARNEVESLMTSLQAQGRKDSALYVSLEAKDQQLQTLQTLQTSSTTVVRPAAPGTQISPHPKRDAALGLVLGLMLGLGLVFGLEALDTRIRSTTELSDGLGGLPLLARLPPPSKEMQKRNELAMVVQPKHNAAEAFRLLRTNLEFVRLGAGDVRLILVTSGLEKEGKSTTAANLAVAEARSGRRVALVDLDLRRPYIDRFFRLSAADGITDVALGRVELEDALQRIDLNLGAPEPGAVLPSLLTGSRTPVAEAGVLDVLVSGPLPPDPGEFAASYRLAEILAQIRKLYDTVIVDTPPVLWVGDALTLSSQADGIILITRMSALRRPMIRELRRILDLAPSRKLGFVVTGPISKERGVYSHKDGYSYGYGYGYGSSDRERDKETVGGEKLGSIDGLPASTTTRGEDAGGGSG